MRFVKEEGTCLISKDGKKLLREGGQDHPQTHTVTGGRGRRPRYGHPPPPN